ncbi:hypothetical protein C6571_18880 (plasmid) [Simplicispira suum]|uniref:Uncharacterized protein n=1 Tax=Simplicispira suum TaxID=2109915 RepID=A0A2S0N5R3_9BURK|nr:hypothetical protein C6571_18880 [Simplicispira suum]
MSGSVAHRLGDQVFAAVKHSSVIRQRCKIETFKRLVRHQCTTRAVSTCTGLFNQPHAIHDSDTIFRVIVIHPRVVICMEADPTIYLTVGDRLDFNFILRVSEAQNVADSKG